MAPNASVCIYQARKQLCTSGAAFELHVPELELLPGSVTVVAGRSGCGKTTLLDVLGFIAEFTDCKRFEFCSDGKQVDMLRASSRRKAALRRSSLGYVLQQGGLLGFLTAWENILLPLRMSGRMHLAASARELAAQLGVESELNKLPAALSVGQRQRVSVVRALAPRPAVLLADEPTGALDPLTAQDVSRHLVEYARQQGATVVVVTHDVELFGPVADVRMGFELSRESATVHSVLVPYTEPERRAEA